MNRVFLALMLSTAPLIGLSDLARAQSTEEEVVEVPPASEEAIEEAVQLADDAAAGGEEQLPEPGLAASARLSPQVIEAWLEDPASLLASNPSAGPAMVRYVALLAGSDARAIDGLIVLASSPEATRRHVRAIAGGLAEAARAAEQTAPDYAAFILPRVASSGNEQLINDFGQLLRSGGGADIETAELPGPAASPAGGGTGTLSGGGDLGPSGSVGGTASLPTSSGNFPVGSASFSLSGDVTATDRDVSPVRIGG